MEKQLQWTLFLITLSGVMACTDLWKKVFLFPKPSQDSYVTLIPLLNTRLQNFTLCLWTYTELMRGYSVFSYATQDVDNEILLFKDNIRQYSLTIGGEEITFPVSENSHNPEHICVTWESASGVAVLWINAKPLVRQVLKVGYTLNANAKIILGQDQDSYGGSFDINQSFVGEIGNVCMWDYVLPPIEMKEKCSCGNVLNWRNLNYEENGFMVTLPNLWV
ncbi:mucosal pentraxin-like [Macrotis lagotis]|uniref:mucosal pentraxin-like n=1 Tax=Macrotis lagotis TaxID=92651 RepID=UPI003D695BF0